MYVPEGKREEKRLVILEEPTLGQIPFLQQLPTWLIVGFLAFMVWRNMTGLKADMALLEKLPEIEERLERIEGQLRI